MTDEINGHPEVIEPVSEAGKWVSEEEYWARYYEDPDHHYEWNNGILEEKPVSDYRTVRLYGWFYLLLHAYLQTYPIAKLVNLETAFRLAMPDNTTTIRKPDLFVIRNDNPVAFEDLDHSFRGIADICIEAVSDSTPQETRRDTETKKREYALIGVHEYYLLDAGLTHMTFYRRTPQGVYIVMQADSGGVIRSSVLPGFQFRVDDLQRMPSLVEMAQDEVYRQFVLPEYQAAVERAAQEHQRAEQERQRAERLAARLRALGVDEE
jgi:Uma2 family endonuclease